MNRAVFLDLNGTLVLPIKVESPSDLRLIPGVKETLPRLCGAGFLCPVVTVQSSIGKGTFSEQEFIHWFQDFSKQLKLYGAFLIGPYICPHRFGYPCPCKKPNILLYEKAAVDHKIDLERSFVIGDSASDVEAAYRFHGKGCLVKTGWGSNPAEVELARPYTAFVADSFSAAVEWILQHDIPGGFKRSISSTFI